LDKLRVMGDTHQRLKDETNMDEVRGTASTAAMSEEMEQPLAEPADQGPRPSAARPTAKPRLTSVDGGSEGPSLSLVLPGKAAPSPADRLSGADRFAARALPLPEPEILPFDDDDERRLEEEAPAPRKRALSMPMPRLNNGRFSLGLISFLIVVALPIIGSSIYYGLIASNQYVSEFHFSVRSQQLVTAQPIPLSSTSVTSQAVSTLANQAAPPDMLSNYAVIDYMSSPTAIDDLSAKLPLRDYFTSKDADWFSRLRSDATRERFVKYWQHMVTPDYDPSTGLATVKVYTFRPEQALAIATALAESAEKLVNEMEERAREDSISFAQRMVDHDQKWVEDVNRKLLTLRKQIGAVDPHLTYVTENQQVALTLVQSLAQLRTQYATALNTMHNPDAPTLKALRDQITATENQLAATRGDIATTAKGAVLPSAVGEFDQTQLEMTLAQQSLTASIANLEAARASAITQTLYVLEHVKPHLPQGSEYPKRLRSILLIALGAFGSWVCGIMIFNTVRGQLA